MSKLPDDGKQKTGRSTPGRVKMSPGQHLPNDLLLLSVDGELSADDAARVSEHLEACWSCRARRDRIEESIADVVDYRNCLLKPYLPPPKGDRAVFVAMLDEYLGKLGRPSLLSRLIGVIRSASVVPPRPVWISALIMASLVLLLLTTQWHVVPSVSASEFLAKARTSEVATLRATNKPVVYQKLLIRSLRSRGQSLTRTIYRDPIGNRVSASNEVKGANELEAKVQKVFQVAELDWTNPLSAASFTAWRNRLGERNDQVLDPGKNLLTLRTTTAVGAIKEASLTVRAADYHAVGESLLLEDEERIEISELAYEVLSINTINPAIFATELPAATPATPPSPSESALAPTESELAEAELQARVALHAAGADLGEQIEVVRNPRGPALVRGLAGTPERKQELLAALQGIPQLDVQLQTLNEALAQRQSEQSEETTTPNTAVVVAQSPALQDQLVQRFPKTQDRAAFIDRVVERAQTAMAHAWALRRLEERYTSEEIARLNQGGRQTLELLIRDHVTTTRQCVSDEAQLLASLVTSTPRPDLLVSGAPFDPGGQTDWRGLTEKVFGSVQTMQQAVIGLLGSNSGTPTSAEVLSHDLDSSLTQLNTELLQLSQAVNGPFLSRVVRSSADTKHREEKRQ